MNDMRTEVWMGYEIRFIDINGEWYAILKDICDALGLKTFKVSQRLDPRMIERVPVEVDRESIRPTKYGDRNHDIPLMDTVKSSSTVYMLAVNEDGIYLTLYASRKLEARKFQMWSARVMRKLREQVGLKQYEVMRMTEPEIQEEIDHMLDDIFYDEETGTLMQSVTVAGGDVEQVPFEV